MLLHRGIHPGWLVPALLLTFTASLGAQAGVRPPAEPPGEKEEEDPGREDEDPETAARIREIEALLLAELEALEERIRSLKLRFLPRALPPPVRPAPPPAELPPVEPPPARRPARKDLEPAFPGGSQDEVRYQLLIRRQEEILRRWREGPGPNRRAGGAEPGRIDGVEAEERAALRTELRAVLAEVLEMRERAREIQLQRLRRELEDLERAMSVRRGEAERRKMVDARLEELLGEGRAPGTPREPVR